MSQAHRIISILGEGDRSRGIALLSEITGVLPSGVHRWSYPKIRGGTGGHIPVHYHQQILDGARKRGIELSPDDFFERVDGECDSATRHRESAQPNPDTKTARRA